MITMKNEFKGCLNWEIGLNEKKKKLQINFGSLNKVSTFAVPTETKGKLKKDKYSIYARNISRSAMRMR